MHCIYRLLWVVFRTSRAISRCVSGTTATVQERCDGVCRCDRQVHDRRAPLPHPHLEGIAIAEVLEQRSYFARLAHERLGCWGDPRSLCLHARLLIRVAECVCAVSATPTNPTNPTNPNAPTPSNHFILGHVNRHVEFRTRWGTIVYVALVLDQLLDNSTPRHVELLRSSVGEQGSPADEVQVEHLLCADSGRAEQHCDGLDVQVLEGFAQRGQHLAGVVDSFQKPLLRRRDFRQG
mmetsp:Transcript_7933/g.17293  ORF Transcript_7933/g.17293 Transcript_7933/m.17293 type:complete len:236 (-) Transcript_7933:340-1047(-)